MKKTLGADDIHKRGNQTILVNVESTQCTMVSWSSWKDEPSIDFQREQL